jgi:hypothetical protein
MITSASTNQITSNDISEQHIYCMHCFVAEGTRISIVIFVTQVRHQRASFGQGFPKVKEYFIDNHNNERME